MPYGDTESELAKELLIALGAKPAYGDTMSDLLRKSVLAVGEILSRPAPALPQFLYGEAPSGEVNVNPGDYMMVDIPVDGCSTGDVSFVGLAGAQGSGIVVAFWLALNGAVRVAFFNCDFNSIQSTSNVTMHAVVIKKPVSS